MGRKKVPFSGTVVGGKPPKMEPRQHWAPLIVPRCGSRIRKTKHAKHPFLRCESGIPTSQGQKIGLTLVDMRKSVSPQVCVESLVSQIKHGLEILTEPPMAMSV